jgi:hypothetical protein
MGLALVSLIHLGAGVDLYGVGMRLALVGLFHLGVDLDLLGFSCCSPPRCHWLCLLASSLGNGSVQGRTTHA